MSDRKLARANDLSQQLGRVAALVRTLQLAWALFWDPRVPVKVKVIWAATWIYIVSPIDFLPAVLVGPLGLADDVVAFVFGTGLFIHSCPPEVVEEHRERLFPSSSGEDE